MSMYQYPYIPLLILAGPTGVGKTALSLCLARKLGGEIVSADSMQVYRGMDIGTAKATPAERTQVPHHLLDVADPREPFDAVRWRDLARETCKEIAARGHLPVVCGGTGFYIQALLYDIDFTEHPPNLELRKRLEKLAVSDGPGALHRMLEEVDPESACAIPSGNVRRVVRALEFYESNRPLTLSAHNAAQRDRRPAYPALFFVLTRDRGELYRRIDSRVDSMREEGLLDEIKGLLQTGCRSGDTAMQALGYKELVEALEGRCSFEEAWLRIQRDSRHYAKRQLTWFRRERDAMWVDMDAYPDAEAAAEALEPRIRSELLARLPHLL